MKDFIVKHPIVTLLIISEITTMIQNIAIGSKSEQSMAKRVAEEIGEQTRDVIDTVNEKTKRPIGFAV